MTLKSMKIAIYVPSFSKSLDKHGGDAGVCIFIDVCTRT
jgi:hypothetical protein